MLHITKSLGWIIFAISILFWLTFAIVVAHSCDGAIFQFYSKNLRASSFTAFLTISIFLLSLKTFIVTTMKKEVFDDNKYLEDYTDRFPSLHRSYRNKVWVFKGEKEDERNTEVKCRHLYFPLKNLSDTLFISIVLAISASLSQFTLGFIDSPWTAGCAIYLSLLSITLLVYSLIQIKANIDSVLTSEASAREIVDRNKK